MSNRSLFFILAAAVLLAACGKTEEKPKPVVTPAQPPVAAPAPVPAGVTAAAIGLGKAIGADKKVNAATENFAKGDTFYVSIDTTGAGTATLRAKWTYHKGGQVAPVKEDTQTIAPTGPATSEFHISKPDGWPVGDYQVELFLNDKPIGSKKFAVQ
jgi:hypothetical protein